MSLTNVLYVPSLYCTLISVSRILKQTKCVAMFTDTMCILQDRSLKTLIGTGEERGAVYYLADVVSAKIHSIDISTDQEWWHRRSGHPSFMVLSDLPIFFSNSKSASSRPCDVCFRAKQARGVFYDSFNKAGDFL